MKNRSRNQSLLRRMANTVRPIPKKLWRHKAVTAIRVGVGATTFMTMVFAAYYGLTSWKHQQQVVAEADLRRVEAEVVNYNEIAQRWTETKVNDVAKLPLVAFGHVRKEVTIQLTLDGDKVQHASLEGVVGREPELQESRLAWGKPVGRQSEPAVMLSQRLFERLGGRLDWAGSPQPGLASVTVTRVKDGTPQTERLQMRIAGLLRRDSDKVYAPLDLAIQLDRWQTHKSDSPLGECQESFDRLVSYDAVDAYVPDGMADRVAEEETAFGVRAERAGEVDVLCAAGDIWAEAVAQDSQQGTAAAGRPSLPAPLGCEEWPVWLFEQESEGRRTVFAALRENDPRWQSAPRGAAPEFGELLVLAVGQDGLGGRIPPEIKCCQIGATLPGVPRADVYCTDRSLQWLRFDPQQSAAVRRQIRIDIDGYEAAVQLHRLRPGEVHADEPVAWAMYEADVSASRPESGSRGSGQETLPNPTHPAFIGAPPADLGRIVETLREQSPEWECGIVRRGVVRLDPVTARTPGDRDGNSAAAEGPLTRVRFVPPRFFDSLTASCAWQHFGSEDLPCVVLGEGKRGVDLARHEIGRRPLRPLTTIACPQTEVWFPDALSDIVPAEAAAVGFVTWGAWHQGETSKAAVARTPSTAAARCVFSRMPQQFWLLQDSTRGDVEALLNEPQLDCSRLRVSQLLSLPVRVQHGGAILAERIVAEAGGLHATEDRRAVLVRRCPAGAGAGPVVLGPVILGRGSHEELLLRQDPNVLPGDAIVPRSLFQRLAFEYDDARRALPVLGRPVPTVRLAGIHGLQQMQRRLNEQRIRLEPIDKIPQQRLLKYSVRAKGPSGESLPVSAQKASELVMARPTFHAVFPRLAVKARLGGDSIEIRSVQGGDDLRWFEAPLLAGRPLDGEARQQGICLPAKLAKRQFPGLSPEEMVGRTVRLRLSRQDSVPGTESGVALLLKVESVSSGDDSLAPLESVTLWRLWQDGRLVYDQASGEFRTPAQVYQRQGFISAVFYASSDDAVRPLVEHLESLGCDVEHRLDDQQGLARLAIALATLVVLFVSGSILNASANSGAVSWMDLATKFKEIGIKMAYGVTRWDIVLAYVAEGFVVGVMACAAGTALVGAVDPFLRDLIGRTIGLGADFFVLPMFGLAVAWLYGLAGAVVVGLNVIGTLLPTWLALRKPPVELLR